MESPFNDSTASDCLPSFIKVEEGEEEREGKRLLKRSKSKQLQQQSSFRNDRIKRIYGAPCPYKSPPIIVDYSRPGLKKSSSGRREFIAPISRASTFHSNDNSSQEDRSSRRPITSSLVYPREVENTANVSNNHDNEYNGSAGKSKQRRPASTSSPSSSLKSPRKLKLFEKTNNNGRGASILLENTANEMNAHFYELDQPNSIELEERAMLSISAALVDTKRSDQNGGRTAHQTAALTEGDYYEEIREDKTEDVNQSLEKTGNDTLKADAPNDYTAESEELHESLIDFDEKRIITNARHANGRRQFRHYPPHGQDVSSIDSTQMRKLVPSYDKNYLRARPLPVSYPRPSKHSRPSFSGVKDRLGRLGLFTSPMNDPCEGDKQPASARQFVGQKEQRSARPASCSLARGESKERASSGYARRVTSAVASKRVQSKQETANSIAMSKFRERRRQNSPVGIKDIADKEVFEVGMMVQCRYKDRSQWWDGKVVARHTPLKKDACKSFTYDVRYSETTEKHVPAHRIRRRHYFRPNGSASRGAHRIAHQRTQDEPNHDDPDLRDNLKAESTEKTHSRSNGSVVHEPSAPPPLIGSQRIVPDNNKATIPPDVSAEKTSSEAADRPLHRPPFQKSSLLNGIKGFSPDSSPLKGLRKTRTNEKSAEEKLQQEKALEEKRDKEKKEQERLQRELTNIAMESKKSIAFTDLTFERTIGRGRFASVHRIKYKCKVHGLEDSLQLTSDRLKDAVHVLDEHTDKQNLEMTLAVKTPEYRNAYPLYGNEPDAVGSTLASSAQIAETIREVQALTVLSHPNIINFYGITLVPRICLVFELLDVNLAQILKSPSSELKVPLDNAHKIEIARDLCAGLKYMHEQHFAHLDVKPHNIMLSLASGGYAAKLVDFGTCREVGSEQLTGAVGTSGYTAPEVSVPGRYDHRADIFSFAIVLWEMLLHADQGGTAAGNPFAGKDLDEAAGEALRGVRPSLDGSSLPELNEVVAMAWASEPASRLSMEGVMQSLNRAVYTSKAACSMP